MESTVEALALILTELGLEKDEGHEVVELSSADPAHAQRIVAAAEAGPVLATLPGRPEDTALCRLRDALWPACHVVALVHVEANGRVLLRTAAASRELPDRVAEGPLTVLVARNRTEAMGRVSTRAKFDANAPGWNGNPSSPGYGHYRWMRRLMADVARPELGQRALDAGCGTGWVGIETALRGAMVSAFDPSPAMVELARANAASAGVDLDVRVGFVEEVHYERPFDLVLNAGVISFAPDTQAYLDQLDALVKPGGLLVIGDINPLSRGFLRRRRHRPLLPARELNGLSRPAARAALEARGFTLEQEWSYQLTYPVPELMALAERSGRSLPCGLLLALNRSAVRLDRWFGAHASAQFDSWILRARKAS